MIRVMTFNIRYGTADDGVNSWENRKTHVLDRINAFNPDLFGIQECRDDDQAVFLKKNLPDYQFIGTPRGRDSQSALEMAPIFFKKSVFEEIKQGVFWLSDTPEILGSKSWGSAFPRTVTWVKLKLAECQELLFVNTHFDYHPSAALKSADVLLQQIEEIHDGAPVVLTGDFNATKNEPPYRMLLRDRATRDQQLVDVHRIKFPEVSEDVGTYNAFGLIKESKAFDWILVSNHFQVLDAGVDQTMENNIYPSDHFPVYAVVDFK